MSVLIFANGDIEGVEWIRPYLTPPHTIIAADGGTRHLLALGIFPDVVVGDMDSLSPEVAAWLETAVVQHIRFPVQKDETDLELALLHAAAQYEGDILVFGAFGGRVDQALGNIFLLAHPTLYGRCVELVDRFQRLRLINAADGVAEVHGRSGDTLSLIPLGVDVQIRATTGLAWSLQQETLAFGPARGISNQMTADVATIAVGYGRLICIHTRQEWGR
ncbi:MAG: thiamine diphosphokinase [Ardenticatenaceae bacterium]|nr:thiamine diphosphokinase [Ardenticatenaceae bacterium]MCB8990703.1 thiamine diphosphokinase [Ardenticatenaceae bacterium]